MQEEKKNMTETAWLRKRCKSVQEAVSKAYEDVDAVDVPIPGLESLSGAALQEAQRLRKAVEKRKVEAHQDQFLLPSETPSQKVIQSRMKKDKADDKKRTNAEREIHRLVGLTQNSKDLKFVQGRLQGKTVWIDGPTDTERQHLLNQGVHSITSDLGQADVTVFLVENQMPQKRALWTAMVKGGFVVARSYLSTSPSGVFFIDYRTGLNKPLKLNLTRKFKRKYIQLAGFFEDVAANDPRSKWSLTEKNMADIILCVPEERKSLFKPGKRVYTVDVFSERLSKLMMVAESSGRVAA